MRIWVEIRVEHAASCESFDHTELLNPQQHKRGPDVIEKLHGNEQNPERNFVLLALKCESNTIVPNKHSRFTQELRGRRDQKIVGRGRSYGDSASANDTISFAAR